jgi:hypothetical protein
MQLQQHRQKSMRHQHAVESRLERLCTSTSSRTASCSMRYGSRFATAKSSVNYCDALRQQA